MVVKKMIAFTVILIVLLDSACFAKKVSFKRKAMILFCSLYPISFCIAYLNGWIPLGLLYYGITETNILMTNLAYIVFQIVMLLFPDPFIHTCEEFEFPEINILFDTVLICIMLLIYLQPYLPHIGEILSASTSQRRDIYGSINCIDTFRIFINLHGCLALYSKTYRNHKACLLVSVTCMVIVNGMLLFCGNRRETFLILLIFVPLLTSKASEWNNSSSQLLSKRKKRILMACAAALLFYMLAVPYLRQGRKFSLSSIGLILQQIFGDMDCNAPYQTLAFEFNNCDSYVLFGSYIKAIPKMITGVLRIPINVDYTMESFVQRMGDFFGIANYGVGWTYSPFSEAYISFGYVGLYLLFPLCAASVLYYTSRNKAYSQFDKGLFYMLSYQFFRGDLANFMQIFATYMLIAFIIKYFNRKVRVSTR